MILKKLFILIVYACFFCVTNAFSQKISSSKNVDNILFDGNNAYHHQKYNDAKKDYDKAINKNSKSPVAYYNRANASFQLKKLEDARKDFEIAIGLSKDKSLQAKAYFNIGNTFMVEKKWQEAVDAFKNSLRRNPSDQETKYNLAYAQKMLEQQNKNNKDKNQDKKDKDNKENKDKDKSDTKENKDKEQQQKEQDQQGKDDPKKDEEKKDKQPQQPKEQEGQMTEQKANQILRAMEQEERKVQEKKADKIKSTPSRLDKDW